MEPVLAVLHRLPARRPSSALATLGCTRARTACSFLARPAGAALDGTMWWCTYSRGQAALAALLACGLAGQARADRGGRTAHAETFAALARRASAAHDAAAGEPQGDDDEHESRRETSDGRDDAGGPGISHKVAPGETLSAIALHYGVSVQAILDRNPGLDADRIREGQTLEIGGGRRSVRISVQAGDTLSAIAHAQSVSLAELRRWNPGLDPDHIRAGQELSVFPRRPPSLSESIGFPGSGQLVHGRRLRPGSGYAIRDPDRSYATDETVRDIESAFAQLRRRDPGAPRLFVHDLSLRHGGPMTEHRSHQSGRDADIAYPQKHCEGPCDFRPLGPNQLDAARTFELLRYWLERDELEAVFIDYRLQAPIYHYARAHGATAEQLQRWFQYPHGRDYPLGIIRHFPKHFDHMHVRFACPGSDHDCRTYRPVLMRMLHAAAR